MSNSMPWASGEAEAVPYSSTRQRSRSGSRQHSPQQSRQYAYQYGYDDDVVRTAAEQDSLAPLSGQPRKHRQRIESVSSIGSSVAPVALPQHRSRRNEARPISRGDEARPPVPSIKMASHDSARSGLSEWQNDAVDGGLSSIGEGGLEAWLRSQAVSVGDGEGSSRNGAAGPTIANGSVTADALPFRSFAPTGRVQGRRYDSSRAEAYEGMSDAARSVGAKSAGPRHDGTGSSRRKSSKSRANIPDWEASAVDADAAGIGVRQSSSRLLPGKTDRARDWLDVDSQVASERRRVRRELSPGTLSASGVRLREGVRRMNRPSGAASGAGDGESSIDALLAAHQRGTMSASPSMGVIPSAPKLPSTTTQSNFLTTLPSQRNLSGILGPAKAAKDSSQGSPMRAWAKAMLMERGPAGTKTSESTSTASMFATVTSAVMISMLLKWVVGFGGWSGKGSAPLHGDFEAQRHWIEITTHLPPKQWYYYDLPYWGLDYPPLTAHVSRWCGRAAAFFPALAPHFALDSSRGSEAPELVLYMRASVLVLDALVYVPAVLFFLSRKLHGRGRRTRVVAMLTVLLQPAIILVDHGHFQYNTVMLGLAAASFAFLYTSLPNPDIDSGKGVVGGATNMRNRMKFLSRRVSYDYIVAAVFFSLSLCFKQMALYYAPAVFAIMLGRCVGLARIGFERGLICFSGIGLATIVTFAIVFRPWLLDVTQLGQIAFRIFPMARGLFEDKVSNVWCFLSVLPLPAKYKLKNALSVDALARLSLATTLAAILLPCVHAFIAAAETVHIEMFLEEDSKRQVQASEKRQAEGSVVASSLIAGRRAPKYPFNAAIAPSEVGSDLASLLSGGVGNGGAARSNISGMPGTSTSTLQVPKLSVPQHTHASSSPSPAASVLPYAMLSTSLAFFLFGFQTHEKSILLPLLPVTLLISVKADEWGAGAGKTDWEWAVLMNNVGTFSMWPLLQRDGIALQYIILTFGWNWAIGHRPFSGLTTYRKSFVAWFGVAVHLGMLSLHAVELASPVLPTLTEPLLRRYPDLFAVLNVLLSTPTLAMIWLWSLKRQLEVGFACGVDTFGMQRSSQKTATTKKKSAAGDALGDSVDRKTK